MFFILDATSVVYADGFFHLMMIAQFVSLPLESTALPRKTYLLCCLNLCGVNL